MFIIRYDTATGPEEHILSPAPAEVDYPPRKLFTTIETQDGNVVVQRPLHDSRTRAWKWRGYGPRHEPFATQWALLASLETRARLNAGFEGTVEIWEDETDGGFDRTDAEGNRVFTRVKVLQVDRQPGRGGGPVIFESLFEFVVSDPTFEV